MAPRRWSADPRKTSVPCIQAHRCVWSGPPQRGGLLSPVPHWGEVQPRVEHYAHGHQVATRWESWECPAAARGTRVGPRSRECQSLKNWGFLLQPRASWPTPAFCSRVSSAGYSTWLASHSLKSAGSRQLYSRLGRPWRPERWPGSGHLCSTHICRPTAPEPALARLPCPLGGPLFPC